MEFGLLLVIGALIILITSLSLALVLSAVGLLGILHLIIGVLLGSFHQLLDGSITARLLGFGGVAGAAVDLFIIVRGLVIGATKKLLEILIVFFVLIADIGLIDLEGRAGNRRDVALAIGLGFRRGINGSHGNPDLEDTVRKSMAEKVSRDV
ncbi:hypothetical protein VTJ49DRAFT_6909 [Mycothermus thermophilus]|uniref:Uncharacterized protein n=1 Tax=Humicola insolens TaxID=85995 RepID=A0ABR3VID5_HUMIN